MSLLASIPRTYPASLLLNFDGANNSTTFTDSSSYNHTGTAYGNAKISITQSKFGGSSGYFDGTGDYVQFPYNSIFDLSSGDWTLEAWFYPIALAADMKIASNAIISKDTNGSNFNWNINVAQNGIVFVTNNVGNIATDVLYAYTTISTNIWHHVAIVKDGSYVKIYLNGGLVDSKSMTVNNNATNSITIGCNSHNNPNSFFNGYIDSLRVIKGVALYTGSAYVLPNVPSSKNAIVASKLNNHIVMTSTKSGGDITGYVSTSSGYYTVNWWDGTKTTYSSGANFAKAAIGGNQSITIYPSLSNGSLDGYFYNVDVSNNNLTSVRAFYSRFITSAGFQSPGFSTPYQYWYTPTAGWRWRSTYVAGPYIPGSNYNLNIGYNNLDSSALNQVYTDLLNGNGSIEVSDNAGGDSDNPSIATTKGYTVYGSLAPYTTLLLNLNSNYTDSSSQNISVSGLTGSPSFSTSIKKYGSASLSLNGGATIPSFGTSSFSIPDLSQVDWTVEFWIYRPTITSGYEGIIYLANSSNIGLNMHLYTNNSFNFNDGANTAIGNNNTAIGSGQWYHVAGVSKNNVKKLFVNGILADFATQATPAGPYKLSVGRSLDTYWTTNGLKSTAYIDDLRIIKGKALYNNDFVPPSSELTTSTTTVTPGTTILLLKGDGTNNGTIFTDDGHKALTATRNGNTITSTTAYKYGTASIYFDGTGDYLSYSTGKDNFNFLNSNFTIECWIRPSSVTGARVIFSKRVNTGTYGGFIFQCNGNKLNILATNNGSSWGINLDSTSTLSINTWYHVAATRSYDTFKIFIDGNLEGSQTIKDFIISSNSANVAIGAGGSTGGQEFFGYIDDLRIVRGASLYNNTFTPPSSPLGLYP